MSDMSLLLLTQPSRDEDEVDELDERERQHEAAEAVDEQVAAQQRPTPAPGGT